MVAAGARATIRKAVWQVGRRFPLGVGRVLGEHAELKRQLRRLQAQQRETSTRFALAHRQMVAAALGRQPEEVVPAANTGLQPDQPLPSRTLLRRLRDQGRLVDALLAGQQLEAAVAQFARDRVVADDRSTPRSLSQALLMNPSTAVAGHLGSAIVAAGMGQPELAWSSLRELPPHVWQPLAAAEYFQVGFRVDPEAAATTASAIIDEPPAELPPAGWTELVKAAFGAHQVSLAQRALKVADELAGQDPGRWAETAPARDWLRHWLGNAPRPAARPPLPAARPPLPAGHVPLAVLDYKQPDRARTSSNLGDYVQTLASLGHLVRYRNLRFHGSPELVKLADELQGRVRPDRVLDTPDGDVTLIPVNRDASNRDPVPERTWLVAFGWYMHHSFGRYDFPMHPNLRPLFISFHCNRPEILTPEVVDHLRTYGPVGCRDWTTVDMLLSVGVPAFFTGCLTTTISTVFPELADHERPSADAPVAYVDVAPAPGGVRLTQEHKQVRDTDLVQNLRDALDLLEGYRRRYSSVVTSRLHCYLPVRSLGAGVEFRPRNPADIRFNGLAGLTATEYGEMQQGISDRLEAVLAAILAGKDEADVYATWRDLCAPDVARAQQRQRSVPPMPPPSFDLATACAGVRAAQVDIARSASAPDLPEVHVALALDGNLKAELPVVVEGLAGNATSPLHLWILCRDHGPDDYRHLAALFPEVSFTWLPCDEIDYGPVLGMLPHITVSTMDRLLLPDLLPELDRIIYHDIDALPLADVTPLYHWDLQGRPLAGRSAVSDFAVSGFGNLLRSARRLREDPAAAHECIRRMCARHQYDFTGFNAGILVLDLARMRADDFCRQFIPFVERYGMNDQEVLNCYAGPDHARLPPQWNSFPAQETVTDPRIIHWAGAAKPWKHEYVLLREKWEEAAGRQRDRERRLISGQ